MNEKVDVDDFKWLLHRIQSLESMPNRPPTHSNIWQGSYDVWFCEQDRLDAVNIPRQRMKDAEDRGLIQSSKMQKGKFEYSVWSLTDLGRSLC